MIARIASYLPRRFNADWLIRTLVLSVLVGGLLTLPGTVAYAWDLNPCDPSAPVPSTPVDAPFGMIFPVPDHPPTGEAFGANATTTPFAKYGWGGLTLETYDLGCSDLGGRVGANAGTYEANFLGSFGTLVLVLTTGMLMLILDLATFWLHAFDSAVEGVFDALYLSLFRPYATTAIILIGGIIIARSIFGSNKTRMDKAVTTSGWALLVLTVLAFLSVFPVGAAQVADKVVTQAVTSGFVAVNGQPETGGTMTGKAAGAIHYSLGYRYWIGAELGDPNSAVAKKYGPALFDAHTLSWDEYKRSSGFSDGAERLRIIKAKQKQWDDTAAKIKAEDEIAYGALTGRNVDQRRWGAFGYLLSSVAVGAFLFFACCLIVLSYLLRRLAVMLSPGIALVGMYFPKVVTKALALCAATIVNTIVFGMAVAVYVRCVPTILESMPYPLSIILLGAFTVALFMFLRPIMHLRNFAGLKKRQDVIGSVLDDMKDLYDKLRNMAWEGAKIAATAAATGGATATAMSYVESQRVRYEEGTDTALPPGETFPVPYPDRDNDERPNRYVHSTRDDAGPAIEPGVPERTPRPHPGRHPGGELPPGAETEPAVHPPLALPAGSEPRPGEADDRHGRTDTATPIVGQVVDDEVLYKPGGNPDLRRTDDDPVPQVIAEPEVDDDGREVYVITTMDGDEIYTVPDGGDDDEYALPGAGLTFARQDDDGTVWSVSRGDELRGTVERTDKGGWISRDVRGMPRGVDMFRENAGGRLDADVDRDPNFRFTDYPEDLA